MCVFEKVLCSHIETFAKFLFKNGFYISERKVQQSVFFDHLYSLYLHWIVLKEDAKIANDTWLTEVNKKAKSFEFGNVHLYNMTGTTCVSPRFSILFCILRIPYILYHLAYKWACFSYLVTRLFEAWAQKYYKGP